MAVMMAKKELLTLEEMAKVVQRAYGTVYRWALDGRFETRTKVSKGRVYRRVPVAEANRVKEEIAKGTWF
jgi:hypothetical protein